MVIRLINNPVLKTTKSAAVTTVTLEHNRSLRCAT